MPTLSITTLIEKRSRVTVLLQMPRDRQASMTDTHDDPHQLETDGKDFHQHMVDETIKSAITGVLCKRVLAYVKWCKGYYLDIDVSVMDSLGWWPCSREISVYIDPV
jgi:hypothetical protein